MHINNVNAFVELLRKKNVKVVKENMNYIRIVHNDITYRFYPRTEKLVKYPSGKIVFTGYYPVSRFFGISHTEESSLNKFIK